MRKSAILIILAVAVTTTAVPTAVAQSDESAPAKYNTPVSGPNDFGATLTQSGSDIAVRSIADSTAQPGETVEVTIEVDLSEQDGIQIEDTFNDSLDATITSGFGGFDNAGKDRVTFNNPTGSNSQYTVTYEVTIPENATIGTTYDFSGTVQASSEFDISGDSSIIVQNEPIDATRSISSGTVRPGETIEVTIDTDLPNPGGIQIIDTFDSQLDADITNGFGALDNTREDQVTFNNPTGSDSQYTVAYEVTIPSDATVGSTYEFSGTAQSSTESTISGDNTITVDDTPWYNQYVNQNDVADTPGLNNAINDYLSGNLSPSRVNIVINSYLGNSPIQT